MNAIWYGEIKDFNMLIEQKKKIQPTACTSEQHIKKVYLKLRGHLL